MTTAITKEICAQLSSVVYNFTTPPEGWVKIDSVGEDSSNPEDSFAAAAYYNTETNEVIIAYRGSELDHDDWINNNFGGFGTDSLPPQFTPAKAFYDKVKAEFDTQAFKTAHNITTSLTFDQINKGFTGHSLGGGLAQLMGSLAECSNIQTYTYNGIGCQPLLDDLAASGKPVSGNYSNMHNYMVQGDIVSSLFNQVGTDNHYVINPHPTTLKEIPILVKGILKTVYTIIDQVDILGDHEITNFIQPGAFQETIVPSTYRVLFDLVRAVKGDLVLYHAVVPLVIPFAKILYGIEDAVVNGTQRIFGVLGSPTGGASPIVGGVTYVSAPTIDRACNALMTLDLPFIVKAIDNLNSDNNSVIIDDAINAGSVFDNLISSNHGYIESYLNGNEIVYDINTSNSEINVLTIGTIYSDIKQLIENSVNIQVAVLNEDAAGNSTIIGDTGNNLLDGSLGNDKYIFTTGDGQDVINDADELSISVKNIEYLSKRGEVIVNNSVLTGGVFDEATNMYINNNPLNTGVTYNWTGYNGSNLIINYGAGDSVTIENFNNGDLGIQFDISKTKDLDKIPPLLKTDKQVTADKAVNAEIVTNADYNVPALVYEDPQGKQWNVINCEKTSKIINAYGKNIAGSIVDEAGNYILAEINKTLKLNQTPVDYSRLVNNMKAIASGQEVKTVDLAIPPDVYVPTSSTNQPALQDVYYQYTSQPSNNGFLAGLFTIAQIAICIGTGNFVGALLVGLETGIAGQTVGNITSMLDLAAGVVNLGITSIKNIGAIFTSFKNNTNNPITGLAADLLEMGISLDNFNIHSIQEINKSFGVDPLSKLNKLFNKIYGPLSLTRLANVIVNNPTKAPNDYVFKFDPLTGTGSGALPTDSDVFKGAVETAEDPAPYKLAADKGCPLSLDMDNDGIETLDIDQTNIYFNTQNTSFSTKTGWLKGDDALLAIDKDGDGFIAKQDELFGNETTSGFSMLKTYDSNNDNVINSSDTQFSNLKVWQDVNENGITDSGELKTLTQAGITSISLNTQEVSIEQNQNTITAQSTYTRADGTTGDIFNVNFAFNKIYTQYTGNYELSLDVLDMPWIRGYGQVVDLQLGMTQDASLKALVKELSQMTDAREIYNRMDELLAKWTGSESIDPNAMSGSVNSRELAILNKFLPIRNTLTIGI